VKKLLSVLMLLAMAVGALPVRAQVEINTEAEQFRQNVESKIIRMLETYLGARSKVLASVNFTYPDPTAPETPTDASATASTETWLTGKLRIESTQVDVRVSETLDDATIQQVQQLITRALQGLNPQVRIEKVAFPEALPEPPKTDPKAEEKKTEAPMDPLEQALHKYGALVPLVAALVVGLGLLLASTSASRMVASAASEIAAGIRSMRPTVSSNPDKPLTISSSEPIGGDSAKSGKTPPVPPRLREHFRNVAFAKKMIAENPLPFSRALSDSEEDLRGLRWLLTNIADEERRTLQKFISPERLLALSDLPSDGENPWDSSAWLQNMVENLVVREIAGGSLVEKSLRSEQSLRISTADPQALFKIVTELNEPAVWRVALEFLPKERVIGALKRSDTQLWQTLFAGSSLDEATLRKGAEQIIERLGDASTTNARSSEEKKRFYSNILLDQESSDALVEIRSQHGFANRFGDFVESYDPAPTRRS
jgi:hypothetical protein